MGALPDAGARPLKVFISYRHEDSKGTAWALYWPLETRFGRDNVFFDSGKLRAGDQWLAEIDAAIDDADVLLALIGPAWSQELFDRLRRPGKDYVAHELARALPRRPTLTVIPVLVDGTPPPDADPLPLALKGMAACHVERLRHTDLREDVDELSGRLSEIAQRLGRDLPVPAPAPSVPSFTPPAAAPQMEPPRIEPPQAAQVVIARPPSGGRRTVTAPRPDEYHYEEVLTETRESGVVIFLGAEVNAEDSQTLPDDEKLARYISGKVRLEPGTDDLAEAAQYARAVRGEQKVFEMIREGLLPEREPGYVHRYLAALPGRLKEAALDRRHLMIVTPKYDAALERAFTDSEVPEPYDVVVFMGPGTENPGKFVHVPWDRPAVTIHVPNEYQDLPIRQDGQLDRTLIVRINGSIDDPDLNLRWKDNYVVTEDHYIQYLTGSPLASLVPIQIVEKLKSASYLFLGYTMADWRLRVFLKRLWPGEHLGTNVHWAVSRAPTRLEERLCFTAGVTLYQSTLTDYVDGFNHFLESQTVPQALP